MSPLLVTVLSAYSDHDLVMKGVTHGAVDYLCKPVREQELKNIWQHVIRREKFEKKDRNKSSIGDRAQSKNGESGPGASVGTTSDLNGKVNQKRNNHIEEEADDGEESERGNEDSSSQNKPRVFWSVDLHQKFVGAVNQLGLESESTLSCSFPHIIFLLSVLLFVYDHFILLFLLMQRLYQREFLI